MSNFVLQCVWPIIDDTYTRRQLISQAEADLEQLAGQAHAVITGPALWLIHPAADVMGWEAYAPGQVLVALMPAEPYGAVRDHQHADPQPDPATIRRLIDGNPPAHVRPIERTAAMAEMAANADPAAVASRFGVHVRAVEQAVRRQRHRDRTLQPA